MLLQNLCWNFSYWLDCNLLDKHFSTFRLNLDFTACQGLNASIGKDARIVIYHDGYPIDYMD